MQSNIVRPANLAEREELQDIQVRVSLMWPEFRRRLLDNPDWIGVDEEHITEGRVLVLESHGQTAGFITVTPRTDGDAEISPMFLDPGHWGSADLPRVLFDAAASFAAEQGARALFVQTTESAVFFYENHRFVRAGENVTDDGPAITMRRNLTDTVGRA